MERVLPGENLLSSVQPLYYVSGVLGLAPFSFTNSFVVKEMSTARVLYTVNLLIFMLTYSLLHVVQSVEHTDPLGKAKVSLFIMTNIEALAAISSIFISVTLNGVKSRKVLSIVVKVDRRLLSDSSTTYRKTFIFTLVQAVAVNSYVQCFSHLTYCYGNKCLRI
jgi:hypothetical protein